MVAAVSNRPNPAPVEPGVLSPAGLIERFCK